MNWICPTLCMCSYWLLTENCADHDSNRRYRTIPSLADVRSKHCRASGFRLIRHLLVDAEAVKKLKEHNLDWYIVRSVAIFRPSYHTYAKSADPLPEIASMQSRKSKPSSLSELLSTRESMKTKPKQAPCPSLNPSCERLSLWQNMSNHRLGQYVCRL